MTLKGKYDVLYKQKSYTRISETSVIHSKTPGIAKFKLNPNTSYEFFIIAYCVDNLGKLVKNDAASDYSSIQILKDIVTFRVAHPTLKAIHHFSDFLNKQKEPAPLELLSHIHIIINMLIQQFLEIHNASQKSMHSLCKWKFDELLKITKQIKNHPENKYCIEKISMETGIQIPEIQKGFKELHNQTFAQFIKETRLQKAAQLLRKTELSISEVAYSVGINSRSHFSRVIKNRFGESPTKYRSSPDSVEPSDKNKSEPKDP